jgi:hypothetical protein
VAPGKEPEWARVARQMPHSFTPRQCRERWKNYLNPELVHDPWSREEDRLLMDEYTRVGNRWISIAAVLDGRSAAAVRNRVFLLLRKKTRTVVQAMAALPPPRAAETLIPDENPLDGAMNWFSFTRSKAVSEIDADDICSFFFLGQ